MATKWYETSGSTAHLHGKSWGICSQRNPNFFERAVVEPRADLACAGTAPVGQHHERCPGEVPRVCREDVLAQVVRLVDDVIPRVGVDCGDDLAAAAVQPQRGARHGLLEDAPRVVPQVEN